MTPAFDVGRLAGLTLGHGPHKPGEGFCAMEAIAWAAGLPHSDFPTCTLRSIAVLFQKVNDWHGWANDEERTAWLLPRLRLLADLPMPDEAGEQRVAFALADYAVRVIAAEAMERAGRDDLAAELRALAPVTDAATAKVAWATADAAATMTWAAAASRAAARFACFALADAALAALTADYDTAATATATATTADDAAAATYAAATYAAATYAAAHDAYLRHADGLIAAAVAAAKGGAK